MFKFNQEHINLIAEALSKEPKESNYQHAITNIADMLERDDPHNFDRTNFLHMTKKPDEPMTELGKLFG